MAASIQGIGTAFIGKRDFDPDGSYVTTEWVVFLYLPLVPLRSLRMEKTDRKSKNWFPILSSTSTFDVTARGRPNWKQVLCVYSFVLICVAWAYFFAASPIMVKVYDSFGKWLGAILFWLPACLPFTLRAYARRRMWIRYAEQLEKQQ